MLDKARDSTTPPMTGEEVQDEIDAYRAEQRAKRDTPSS
jgi:hypothetical protein